MHLHPACPTVFFRPSLPAFLCIVDLLLPESSLLLFMKLRVPSTSHLLRFWPTLPALLPRPPNADGLKPRLTVKSPVLPVKGSISSTIHRYIPYVLCRYLHILVRIGIARTGMGPRGQLNRYTQKIQKQVDLFPPEFIPRSHKPAMIHTRYAKTTLS